MRSNLHVGWPRGVADTDPAAARRRRLRRAASLLSLANAAVYLLIGAGVAAVVQGPQESGASMAAFGAVAGAAFLLGAGLLWVADRRWLWVGGALFQAFAIVAYLTVAPQRDPPYEPWGLSLKVAQLLLLVVLAYLAATPEGHRRRVRPTA